MKVKMILIQKLEKLKLIDKKKKNGKCKKKTIKVLN